MTVISNFFDITHSKQELFQFIHSAFPNLGRRCNMLRRSSQTFLSPTRSSSSSLWNPRHYQLWDISFPAGPRSDPRSPSSETSLSRGSLKHLNWEEQQLYSEALSQIAELLTLSRTVRPEEPRFPFLSVPTHSSWSWVRTETPFLLIATMKELLWN